MTSRDFCFWLQGFLELGSAEHTAQSMSPVQVDAVRVHLALVFKHEIDPSMGPEPHQDELNKIHYKQEVVKPRPPSGDFLLRC